MSKIQMIEKFDQIRNLVSDEGVAIKWTLETGKVVVKKDGSVKMSFSLRDQDSVDKDIEVVKRNCVKVLGENIKFTKCNMFGSYRSQCYVICTFKP